MNGTVLSDETRRTVRNAIALYVNNAPIIKLATDFEHMVWFCIFNLFYLETLVRSSGDNMFFPIQGVLLQIQVHFSFRE